MKRILMLICAVWLSGYAEEIRIPPDSSCELNLADSNAAGLLRIRARLDLPEGKEGWGGYFLRMSLDGKTMPPLVNSTMIWNLTKVPAQGVARFSPEKRAYFIKGDSDWIAYNARQDGAAFNRSEYFGNRNVAQDRNNFTEAYYDMIFLLKPHSGQMLKLENLSSRYTIVCRTEVAPIQDGELFWSPPAGEQILPWSWPEKFAETGQKIRLQSAPGEKITGMIALKVFHDAEYEIFINSPFPADVRIQENRIAEQSAAEESEEQRRIRRLLGQNDALAEMQKYAVLNGWKACSAEWLRGRRKWNIPAGTAGALYVVMDIPVSASAGVHIGEILLKRSDGQERKIIMETDVLPFRLPASRRIHGLWTRDVHPGNPAYAAQAEDLSTHGINTVFLDGWGTPVRFDSAGNVDLKTFEKNLDQCLKDGFNKRILIYGLMNPVLSHISRLAGTRNPASAQWQTYGKKLFSAMNDAAAQRGVVLYFHTHDEPDAHPKKTAEFEAMLRALHACGVKTASDCSVIGQKRFAGLLDFNIAAMDGILAGWNGKPYRNVFFPDWGMLSPEEIRSMTPYAYVQVRSGYTKQNRMFFGFMMPAVGLEGVWGFSYYWDRSQNHVASPFPEEDGRFGTTPGWELLREGINDVRYWDYLMQLAKQKQVQPQIHLPEPSVLQNMNMTELQAFREEIINEILRLRRLK